MDKNTLDERQQLLRGKTCQNSLFVLAALIVVKIFLSDMDWLPADSSRADIFALSLTAAFMNIDMALKGAFNFEDKRMAAYNVLMGACGLMLMITNIIHIAGSGYNEPLAATLTYFITGAAFFSVPAVYFPKRAKYLRQLKNDN